MLHLPLILSEKSIIEPEIQRGGVDVVMALLLPQKSRLGNVKVNQQCR